VTSGGRLRLPPPPFSRRCTINAAHRRSTDPATVFRNRGTPHHASVSSLTHRPPFSTTPRPPFPTTPHPPVTAQDQLVVLLDQNRKPIGQEPKSSVHSADTPLHLAFSLYLFDESDRLLMTRRALTKATWPGVWTNTCCGHPMPGELIQEAVHRRLGAELHLGVAQLRCVLPEFAYRARDASGVWENEVCPVFIGSVVSADDLRPNTDEAVDWVWTPWAALVDAMTAAPFAFSPWSVEQVGLMPHPAGRH